MTNTFEALGLSQGLLATLSELGYVTPTPVQEASIRHMLSGADVIAQAQTGTGKTAAYSLPLVERIDADRRQAQVLVLAPTRELAVQVAGAFKEYSKHRRLNVVAIYGGQPIDRQIRSLNAGVHVLVATPGRLIDHMNRGTINLGTVQTVVLDEADEMLAMGFIEDVEQILAALPTPHQTALYSATMPDAILRLTKRYMTNPSHITIASKQQTAEMVEQRAYEALHSDRFEVLSRLLQFEEPGAAMIFCRTRMDVDQVGEKLTARGFNCDTLHGELSQTQRDRVMQRFRTSQSNILVATDVAARGLDVDHVTHVINYELPPDPEVYVHRIGRTGRAGRSGVAISIVTPRERFVLRQIERMTKALINVHQIPGLMDLRQRQRQRFAQQVLNTITSSELHAERELLGQLTEQHDAMTIAAAALRIAFGEQMTTPQADPLANSINAAQRASTQPPRTNNPHGPSGNPQFRGNDRGSVRLWIDIGRAKGIRAGDIVGAIANEANVPGRMIGSIELHDGFSYVNVPQRDARRVVDVLNHSTIRGHRIKANIVAPRKV